MTRVRAFAVAVALGVGRGGVTIVLDRSPSTPFQSRPPRSARWWGLGRFLSDRDVLLVLDNCEHVVDAWVS
jgi:hypothetical protein